MSHPRRKAEKKTGILLVDDERRDLDTVSSILEDAGYTVFKAETATRAIQVAEENLTRIHFLLTDIALPGVNGVELHRTLCERTKLCNVLFISARSGSEVLRFYGLEISDPHFLAKPFMAEELLTRVARLIESKEPLRVRAS
jgi:two-component system OmpR family response regulator